MISFCYELSPRSLASLSHALASEDQPLTYPITILSAHNNNIQYCLFIQAEAQTVGRDPYTLLYGTSNTSTASRNLPVIFTFPITQKSTALLDALSIKQPAPQSFLVKRSQCMISGDKLLRAVKPFLRRRSHDSPHEPALGPTLPQIPA